MKKITAIIIACLLCAGSVFALMSCGGTPETTTVTDKPAETKAQETDAATTAAETEAQTDAATTAAETEAQTEEKTTAEATSPSEVTWYEDELMLFERRDGDSHDPVAADNGVELACKFSIPEGSRLSGLLLESCPTWTAADYSGFVVELYKWDTDYENTVVGDALYSEEFEEWVDNAACELDFSDKAPTGFEYSTYLWVFRGTTDKIGIWAMDPLDDCDYFANGIDCGYGYQAVAYILTPEA
jgi:hypothetical protein